MNEKNSAVDAKNVTREQIEAEKTKNGGWTKETLAKWGVDWPPKPGWIDRLTGDKKPKKR